MSAREFELLAHALGEEASECGHEPHALLLSRLSRACVAVATRLNAEPSPEEMLCRHLFEAFFAEAQSDLASDRLQQATVGQVLARGFLKTEQALFEQRTKGPTDAQD